MKLARISSPALSALVLLLPALAQAHPGHSAFDATAGAPHAGHSGEWASLLVFVALTGGLLGLRWLANRQR
jgi:hypothetical protein